MDSPTKALAVIECMILAELDTIEEAMYAFSVETTVIGNQYKPSSRITTASVFKDELRI